MDQPSVAYDLDQQGLYDETSDADRNGAQIGAALKKSSKYYPLNEPLDPEQRNSHDVQRLSPQQAFDAPSFALEDQKMRLSPNTGMVSKKSPPTKKSMVNLSPSLPTSNPTALMYSATELQSSPLPPKEKDSFSPQNNLQTPFDNFSSSNNAS